MTLDQNLHQTVTRFECICCSMYACGFSVPEMRLFCLFTYPPRSKWISSEKMFFFFQNRINVVGASRQDQNELHLKRFFFLGKLASSVAKRKRIVWSIGFNSWTNWTLYGIIPRFLCKLCLNDISEMFNCWELRRISFFLSQQQYSRVYALFLAFHALVYRWRCFIHFFHKITNIRGWRCISSSKIPTKFSHTFCNITMSFKVMT